MVTLVDADTGETKYEIAYGYSGSAGKSMTVSEGSLSAIASGLGTDYIPQSELTPLIESLEEATGTEIGESEQLTFAKEMVERAVSSYSCSDEVSGVVLKECHCDFPYNFSAEELSSLKESATALQTSDGAEAEYTFELELPYYNIRITSTCSAVLSFIDNIEEHSTNVSQSASTHISALESLEMLNDVVAYDYKSDWPARPSFEL